MILEPKVDLISKVNELKKYIGNTPLFDLKNLSAKKSVKILAKLEWMQFGGSVKSRPAYQIIYDALKNGFLDEGQTLIDASSGNTAIAYASIGAKIGIPVTICIPENASEERKTLLRALDAEIIYTSPFGTTDEAQEIALKLSKEQPDKYFYANQYANDSNWKAHFYTTGPEIWDQTNGNITHFVAGLGTTGSFTGITRSLKNYDENIQFIALQPESAMHGLEGWKHLLTAKIPDIYDDQLPDEIRTIESFEAYDTLKMVSKKEGMLIGPSGGANLSAAIELSHEIDEGTIVTLLPDSADKYGELLKNLF